ncbi:MAG: hypothetical protein CFE24_00700 [Flavobacterium sp. BFFFF2]|nr:MAG: hypothetical protein CFE24_00700 [Flavobacterium sp. BFFFF2]
MNVAPSFEEIVQLGPDIICGYLPNKEITFVNQAVCTISGQSASFYVGKKINEFGYPASFVKDFEAGFDTCLFHKRVENIDIFSSTNNLKNKYFNIQFVPVLHPQNGEVMKIFSISRDVTDSKLIELGQKQTIHELQVLSTRLVNKSNRLQNFAYMLSHDFKSPLNNLGGLLSLYKESKDEEQAALSALIDASFQQVLQSLTNMTSLLSVNQSVEIELESLFFKEVVQTVCQGIDLFVQRTNTVIETHFELAPNIQYNRSYLESLLQNLITNAIKYRHPTRNPHIILTTSIQQDKLLLTCRDNGLGIDLEKVGNQLFGLHQTFHENPEAHGVGLFITKNQIEAMNGRIWVESTPGVGSLFLVEFDLKPIN